MKVAATATAKASSGGVEPLTTCLSTSIGWASLWIQGSGDVEVFAPTKRMTSVSELPTRDTAPQAAPQQRFEDLGRWRALPRIGKVSPRSAR